VSVAAGPPRLAARLLAACVPEEQREPVLGDLEEEWRRLAPGRLWYWRHAAAVGVRLLWLRLGRRERSRPRKSRRESMGQLIQDLRLGGRVLLRKPAFALTAVVTLALGIGANAAIFSVVYGVLLHPLPYREPERLVGVWETDTRRPGERLMVSPASLLAWRERSAAVFEGMAAVNPFAVHYTGGDEPESIDAALVTEDFFTLLGVEPLLGRNFRREDHQGGAARVMLVSYATWQQRFGGDPGLVGRSLPFGPDSYEIVGILPADFRSPAYSGSVYAPNVWWPGAEQSRAQFMRAVARLKPGVDAGAAQSALAAVDRQLAAERPKDLATLGSMLVPVLDQIVGPVRPALLALFGSALLILLIACANVAHLQLARASERRREFAIRAALGAARARLVRQLVTESVWLVLSAALAGMALAHWGIRGMRALAPSQIPRLDLVALNTPVFLFGAGLALVTLLAFSLTPALQASRSSLQPSLKEGGGASSAGRATHRLRGSLVAWQVALAVVLLVGATLLLRSFVSLLRVDPGFRAEGVVSLQVFVYNQYPKPEQQVEYFRQALAELRATPGVSAAGAVSVQPFLFGAAQATGVQADDQPPPAPGQEATAGSLVATGDYFRAAGVPLVRGRVFDDRDTKDAAPVALVSEALSRRLWGPADPLGRAIVVRSSQRALRLEVVGVVGDVRREGLSEPVQPSFYRPLAQAPTGGMAFVVKTSEPVNARVPEIKQAIWRVNRKQPFYRVSTVQALVDRSLTQRRFLLYLLGTFASLALVLATVGIYGVISFVTAQRTREIGLRIALGATPGGIVRLVMGHGLGLALVGAAAGCVSALALSRFVSGLLYGISALDPLTYAGSGLMLLGVAALASYLPARRALRGDPVAALRPE
jgi:putative ABC transport system permease protein